MKPRSGALENTLQNLPDQLISIWQEIPFLRFAELAPFELEIDAYPHEAMIFSAEDRCQQVKIRMLFKVENWTV